MTAVPQTVADAVDAPRRALSWRAAFVLSLGGALLVTVSLGAMAAEIGAASLLVWGGAVLVLTCLPLYWWRRRGRNAMMGGAEEHAE